MEERELETLEEQNQALRVELVAERDRADRAQIEAYIMRELACHTRDIAVSFGCQVLPQSKPYAERVKLFLEDPMALSTEVERRLVDKMKRERKQIDEVEKVSGVHSLSTEEKKDEVPGNGKGDSSGS